MKEGAVRYCWICLGSFPASCSSAIYYVRPFSVCFHFFIFHLNGTVSRRRGHFLGPTMREKRPRPEAVPFVCRFFLLPTFFITGQLYNWRARLLASAVTSNFIAPVSDAHLSIRARAFKSSEPNNAFGNDNKAITQSGARLHYAQMMDANRFPVTLALSLSRRY